jgi:hypothetical protein
MIRTLGQFAKYSVLNVLTVIPAFVVAVMFEMQNGDNDNTAYLLGLILGIFFIVLIIQSVFIVIFRTHRHWVNSVVAMIVMLLTGALLASMVFDPDVNSDYSSVELSLMLNIATEFLGAAVIVVLFQMKRVGVVAILMVGTFFLGLLSTETGQNLDLYTNLSAEIFGTLLTGWVIYRVIDVRDNHKLKQKPKSDEA